MNNHGARTGRQWSCVLLLCCCLLPSLGQAVLVEGLYRASAELASRDSERERRQGFGQALAEVILKITGREEVLELPAIQRALASPDAYVEFWEYRTERDFDPVTGAAREVIRLNVNFFEPQVRRLLDQNSIPIWPDNRPETLVWVVLQEGLDSRRVLAAGEQSEILDLLRQKAFRRGLPLLLPAMNANESLRINADQLWELDEEAIRAASAPYQTESIMVLRLFRSFDGEMVARGTFLFRNFTRAEESYDYDLDALLQMPVNLVAEELSAYYAVLVSGVSSSSLVRMRVEGVNSMQAYARLMRYVQNLVDVNTVDVVAVEGSRIDLELATGGQIRQLMENIALDRNMRPLGEVFREDDQIVMNYQWAAQ